MHSRSRATPAPRARWAAAAVKAASRYSRSPPTAEPPVGAADGWLDSGVWSQDGTRQGLGDWAEPYSPNRRPLGTPNAERERERERERAGGIAGRLERFFLFFFSPDFTKPRSETAMATARGGQDGEATVVSERGAVAKPDTAKSRVLPGPSVSDLKLPHCTHTPTPLSPPITLHLWHFITA